MNDLTSIYCLCDDFFKHLSQDFTTTLKEQHPSININPSSRLSTPEIMTILIAFHLSGFHDLKHFYGFLCAYKKRDFPGLLSYNRFVELIPSANVFLLLLFLAVRGKQTEVNYIDSSAIAVCKNKRIFSHKVFKNLAKRGKTSMGWFFGFKIHLAINSGGQVINFSITPGNVDDRVVAPKILDGLIGKVYGDKGYVSQPLFERLFYRGCQLITALKTNMKSMLHTLEDSIALGKRSLIESVFNVLKNSCRMEHSRHRNPKNFIANLLGALCAYMMRFILEDSQPLRLQTV